MEYSGRFSPRNHGTVDLSAHSEAKYEPKYEPDPMTRAAGTISFMKFTVAVTHEAPWYVARCLDVDVVSQGETVDEAVANLEEALGLYFEGEDLPDSLEPPIITTVLIPA